MTNVTAIHTVNLDRSDQWEAPTHLEAVAVRLFELSPIWISFRKPIRAMQVHVHQRRQLQALLSLRGSVQDIANGIGRRGKLGIALTQGTPKRIPRKGKQGIGLGIRSWPPLSD